MENFNVEEYFHTTKELVDNKIFDIAPDALKNNIQIGDSQTLKHKYNRLS